MEEFLVKNGGSYEEVVNHLRDLMGQHRHFLLEGQLGAGKTTLTKSFAKTVFSLQDLSSPTYNIIHLHEIAPTNKYRTFAHMDLYRIEQSEEFEELGGLEYLDDETTLCWIEWPETARPFLEDFVQVEIHALANGDRKIVVS